MITLKPRPGRGSGVRASHLVHLRVKPPQPLSVRGGPKDQEDWKLWQQEWTNCAKNTKLEQHTPDVQTSLFHHCAGRSVLKIFSALEFGHNESNVDLQTVIQKLEAYFVGKQMKHLNVGISTSVTNSSMRTLMAM